MFDEEILLIFQDQEKLYIFSRNVQLCTLWCGLMKVSSIKAIIKIFVITLLSKIPCIQIHIRFQTTMIGNSKQLLCYYGFISGITKIIKYTV